MASIHPALSPQPAARPAGCELSPLQRERLTLACLIGLPIVLLLVAVAFAPQWAGVKADVLMRDPAAISRTRWYVGMVSNVGVLLWCGAAVLCLFSAVMRRRSDETKTGTRAMTRIDPFLACSGGLTLLLCLDDFFLLHEDVLPGLLGVDEKVVFAAYGMLTLIYLVKFRATILGGWYLPLLAALGLFGGSLTLDVIQTQFRIPGGTFAEDGLKLLGIASWFVYLSSACIAAWRAALIERYLRGYDAAIQSIHVELESVLETSRSLSDRLTPAVAIEPSELTSRVAPLHTAHQAA